MHKSERKIAIIGNGCSSAECTKALRENGYKGEIHIFTDSEWPIYSPMLTTYYVAGKISFEQLFSYGQNDNFYHQYAVDIHSSSPVVSLDTEAKIVINQAGFEFKYDQCLIASGAYPVLPVIKGRESKKIYVMRTVEDAIKLKNAIGKRPHKVLVIGASMVGMKVTEVLDRAGIKVWVADIADRLFPQSAHPDCSNILEERLQEKGISFKFGTIVRKIENNSDSIQVYFDKDNENDEYDFLVFCIGIQPNISFINPEQISIKQGVLVDEYMSTNVPGVYAAGDVAQGKNMLTNDQQTISLLANARYQGRTAGRNMVGIRDMYQGSIPHNIINFLGLHFTSIGDIYNYDSVDKKSNGKSFRQLFWKNGLLVGANFVDTYLEAGIIKNAVMKGLIQNKFNYSNSLSAVQNHLISSMIREFETV